MGSQGLEGGQESGRHSINTQRVSTRSVRSGSDVRHGWIYEDSKEAVVRAVTPDSTTVGAFGIADGEPLRFSPAPVKPYRSRDSISRTETSTSVSNTDEDSAADNRRLKGHRKSKQKLKDTNSSDASPNSFISKTRKRLGSITTSSHVTGRQEDSANFIGYPTSGTSAPFPNLADVRNSLPRPPRRTVSSDTAVTLGSTGLRSPLLANTDSAKILSLMRTTCGRMHGILFFRAIGTSAWESGYCAINVAPGSLICQRHGEGLTTKTLLPDLRGCSVRTRYDAETQSTFLSVVVPATGFGYQLRPPVPETFDSWLAALLCWQPLRPKGVHNKMTKPQAVTMIENRPLSQRRTSDMGNAKGTSIVKVGRMLLLDSPLPTGSQRHMSRRDSDFDMTPDSSPWRRVSCTLHENGTFKLLTEVDTKPICSIKLSQLARCAVQRLDSSVLDAPNCLAIYPQYTISSAPRSSRPLVLGLESKGAYEAWYVLLRALTAPELYGPKHTDPASPVSEGEETDSCSSMFRIERMLAIKIVEAKLRRDPVSESQGSHGARTKFIQRNFGDVDVYADVSLGRDLRARTVPKRCLQSAFWAEEFHLQDLPPMLSTITVAVKAGNQAEQEWTMLADENYDAGNIETSQLPALNGIEIASSDPEFGQVEIQIDDLEQEKVIEKWWQLSDKHGRIVGQVLMKVALSETVVLLESEYKHLSDLLHTFDNGLTTQLAHVLGQELKLLSEVLLDVFQASNTAHEWINTLIDEEIDGIYKDTPPVRMRFSGRIHSNDSYETSEQRELLLRDLSRSATMEANLLFRGNSLVTKALDAHMRRLGKQYLETTLGDTLRDILKGNPECEVDPAKVRPHDSLDRNWSTLISVTNSVWKAIARSASQCPPGMRMIFKHIRSCAEDRYGSFIRTVKYTSVSGFLFLRFFCPAVLNPKLFGLIDDHPPDRARRTFTLIAKSLNVLASMAKFGTKETWMEPMNKFLATATPEFKTFIDNVCSISSSDPSHILEPQFLAPMQIRARLSPMSREGLPTLPYLLDQPKSLAALIDLWMENAPGDFSETAPDGAAATFHRTATEIWRKTKDCMLQAEPAAKPSTTLEPQWQQLLSDQRPKQITLMNPFEDSFTGLSTEPEITALPQRANSNHTRPSQVFSSTSYNESSVVPTSSSTNEPRRMPSYTIYHRAGDQLGALGSANSSTVSFDAAEDPTPNRANSRDGGGKSQLFRFMNPARRKMRSGFGAERMAEHDLDD